MSRSPQLFFRPATHIAKATILIALLCLCHACNSATQPPAGTAGDSSGPNARSDSRDPKRSDPGSPADIESGDGEETWEMLVIQSTRVGYQGTRVAKLQQANKPVVKISSKQYLVLKRFNESSEQTLETSCLETPEGQLMEFESREAMGRELTVTRGKVEGNVLRLETVTGDKRESTSIEWPDGSGGWYEVDHAMRRQPLKPGEKRQLTTLTPVIHRLSDVSLEARDYETTDVAGQSHRLLKIIRKDRIAGATLESVLWVDDRGETLKSRVAGIGLETHRCSREIALDINAKVPVDRTRQAAGPANPDGKGGRPAANEQAFDIGNSTVVKLRKISGNPHAAKRMAYRARLEDGTPTDVFPTTSSQLVEPLDGDAAKITVTALRPDSPVDRNGDRQDSPPTDDDVSPNNWIQSDDPAIMRMANDAVGDETDPWKMACILERLVKETVRSKNFSQAFLSASEVLRSREGDCTEHAVLLAALCRAKKIPARVAIGLVYFAPAEGFAYHMWNVVCIDDRWIPLDGTLGQAGIGAGHLQLASSHLKGSDSRAVFLPVSQVLGRLQLDILDEQPEAPTQSP